MLEKLAGKPIRCWKIDIRDTSELINALDIEAPDAVMHFAAFKSIPDSIQNPSRYYFNNIGGSLSLLKAMAEVDIKKLVFSSSCTVYGESAALPIVEGTPANPINPYGFSKWVIERAIQDIGSSTSDFTAISLRYFNPIGAHSSGDLGEDPKKPFTNLMPILTEVILGRREKFQIFGDSFPTSDGTCVRDYLHVCDLADAHVKALQKLETGELNRNIDFFNVATGTGFSVLEIISMMEKVTNLPILFETAKAREGEAASCFADASKIERLLGWKASRDLETMCKDHWRWVLRHPTGFE